MYMYKRRKLGVIVLKALAAFMVLGTFTPMPVEESVRWQFTTPYYAAFGIYGVLNLFMSWKVAFESEEQIRLEYYMKAWNSALKHQLSLLKMIWSEQGGSPAEVGFRNKLYLWHFDVESTYRNGASKTNPLLGNKHISLYNKASDLKEYPPSLPQDVTAYALRQVDVIMGMIEAGRTLHGVDGATKTASNAADDFTHVSEGRGDAKGHGASNLLNAPWPCSFSEKLFVVKRLSFAHQKISVVNRNFQNIIKTQHQ